MPRIKSLIIRSEVDTAKRAHNCRGNVRHRIVRGDKRLKVRHGRDWRHYCLQCANAIIKRDQNTLNALARDLWLASSSAEN